MPSHLLEKYTCAGIQPSTISIAYVYCSQSIKKDARVLPTCLPGQGGFRKGDVAIKATKQVTALTFLLLPKTRYWSSPYEHH